ncbi:hypothetical protein KFR76_05740 [Corynebacterium diphtheriae]|nr:hypothetical protein KFR76_05740 [Corynebacterium diphtheriae]
MSHVDGVNQAPQDVVVEVDEDVLAALVHGPTQLRDLSDPGRLSYQSSVSMSMLMALLAACLLVVVPGLL